MTTGWARAVSEALHFLVHLNHLVDAQSIASKVESVQGGLEQVCPTQGANLSCPEVDISACTAGVAALVAQYSTLIAITVWSLLVATCAVCCLGGSCLCNGYFLYKHSSSHGYLPTQLRLGSTAPKPDPVVLPPGRSSLAPYGQQDLASKVAESTLKGPRTGPLVAPSTVPYSA
jgi:hypothetical protein